MLHLLSRPILKTTSKLIPISSLSMKSFSTLPKSINSEKLTAEEMENKYLVKTYNKDGVRTKSGLLFVRGNGPYLYSENGDEYLDFCAGIAVSSLGHADPDWAKAIGDQAKQLCHVSNLFHSQPSLDLAKRLVENSSLDKVFFCNSGTEANEAAFKFSRLYGKTINPSGSKTKVVAFKGGFHGRSMGSLSLTYKPAIREPFFPLIPGVEFGEFNNLNETSKLINDDVCAVIVEPIQGEGGVLPATKEFMQGLRHLCDQHQALLICDEVQCGLGRTGNLWGHETYEIVPDIMTLAKPLAGGLPIGAVMVKDHVANAVQAGNHGTTFGANVLVATAANVVLDRILEPGFLEGVRSRGRYLTKKLHALQTKYPNKIKEIRLPLGEEGLFAGIEVVGSVTDIIGRATEKGVLFISAGTNTLRICPPLIVSERDIDRAMDILEESLN